MPAPIAFLLDTHLVLWAASDPARLSSKARTLLQSRDQRLSFSLVSIWEVAIKTSLGRPDFVVDPRDLREGMVAAGFAELPIRAEHVIRVGALPWIHRDPFDRMLVAQCLEDKLTLLTVDRDLQGYGRFVRLV